MKSKSKCVCAECQEEFDDFIELPNGWKMNVYPGKSCLRLDTISPEGHYSITNIGTNGKRVEITTGDVIRIHVGNVIDVVTGDRITKAGNKHLLHSGDYTALVAAQLHLNPDEMKDGSMPDKIAVRKQTAKICKCGDGGCKDA